MEIFGLPIVLLALILGAIAVVLFIGRGSLIPKGLRKPKSDPVQDEETKLDDHSSHPTDIDEYSKSDHINRSTDKGKISKYGINEFSSELSEFSELLKTTGKSHNQLSEIHLMLKNPQSIFAYWKWGPNEVENFEKHWGLASWRSSKLLLRMLADNRDPYDIFVDDNNTCDWYLDASPFQGEIITAYLMKLTPSGDFIQMAVSNSIAVPSSTGTFAEGWEPVSEVWKHVEEKCESSEVHTERMKS
ncbi:hypothetical protein GGQ84_001641 [Desulfitispora alkaliphila]|uniref:DUF4912 domain-containing protein n=1 Tax=Desulfitispora alkaliphila TaxID=622674 RepID=UPI003D1F8CB1